MSQDGTLVSCTACAGTGTESRQERVRGGGERNRWRLDRGRTSVQRLHWLFSSQTELGSSSARPLTKMFVDTLNTSGRGGGEGIEAEQGIEHRWPRAPRAPSPAPPRERRHTRLVDPHVVPRAAIPSAVDHYGGHSNVVPHAGPYKAMPGA